MKKNVLLDKIELTAHELAKWAKHYDKYEEKRAYGSVSPNLAYKAGQYTILKRIQHALLRRLREN